MGRKNGCRRPMIKYRLPVNGWLSTQGPKGGIRGGDDMSILCQEQGNNWTLQGFDYIKSQTLSTWVSSNLASWLGCETPTGIFDITVKRSEKMDWPSKWEPSEPIGVESYANCGEQACTCTQNWMQVCSWVDIACCDYCKQ